MIIEFRNEYRFLSNFWYVSIAYEGMWYRSVEYAYQAAKTCDKTERRIIAAQNTPGDAKRYARGITLRDDWDQVKYDIMLDLLRQKFKNPLLRALLLNTNDQELVEGNTWHDVIWGKCTCPIHKGQGDNMLGRLLMQVRKEIQ